MVLGEVMGQGLVEDLEWMLVEAKELVLVSTLVKELEPELAIVMAVG